jgi:hypothetical protein
MGIVFRTIVLKFVVRQASIYFCGSHKKGHGMVNHPCNFYGMYHYGWSSLFCN